MKPKSSDGPRKAYQIIVNNFRSNQHPGIDYLYRCFLVGDEEEFQLEEDFNKSAEELAKLHNISLEDSKFLSEIYLNLAGHKDINYSQAYGILLERFKKYISNSELLDLDDFIWADILLNCDHASTYEEMIKHLKETSWGEFDEKYFNETIMVATTNYK